MALTEPDRCAVPQAEMQALDIAMGKLSAKYRTVLHLFYFEGYSTEEIGEILGRRPATVRSQLTRVREKLRQLLKGEDDEI